MYLISVGANLNAGTAHEPLIADTITTVRRFYETLGVQITSIHRITDGERVAMETRGIVFETTEVSKNYWLIS